MIELNQLLIRTPLALLLSFHAFLTKTNSQINVDLSIITFGSTDLMSEKINCIDIISMINFDGQSRVIAGHDTLVIYLPVIVFNESESSKGFQK